jgi:hypothetical protein
MATDWKNPIEMAHDLRAARYLCVLCLGAIVIDFGHSLRFDYNMIKNRGKSNNIRWPQLCYILVKLAYFPWWAVTFMVGDPVVEVNCDSMMITSHVMLGAITCLCSALLAFRTLCVWEQKCSLSVSCFIFRKLGDFL